MAGKRHRATARPESDPVAKKKKTEDGTTPAPKKKSLVEPTTAEQQEFISKMLGFFVLYNYPLKRPFGFSSFSSTETVFFAYPVLYRAPPAAGVLPERLPSGDRGYFLGASDPGHICAAIVDAYEKLHPGCNTKVAPWKNWEIYMFNRAYYGATAFEKGPHRDISVLGSEIQACRQWGGDCHRIHTPVARVMNQKKPRTAVYLDEFFAEKLPDTVPQDCAFQTKSDLSVLHQRYTEKLKLEAEIKKDALAKKINRIAEDESDEDDESSSEDQ